MSIEPAVELSHAVKASIEESAQLFVVRPRGIQLCLSHTTEFLVAPRPVLEPVTEESAGDRCEQESRNQQQ